MPLYNRLLQLNELRSSAFIFGPRMTGKTTILRGLKHSAYFDLLDPEAELRYRMSPRLFWDEVSVLPAGSTVVVDEVQRIPELLNYVQMGIDRLKHTYILSGSSARKLRRGAANLLGGRSLDLRLHPLTCDEIGADFSIHAALCTGTLPLMAAVAAEGDSARASEHLRSYISTYIQQEIQMEALTRNVGAFQRFLAVAAQSNAQVIEFANISRDCSVPASTVKEYFQILDDTLLGWFLWPFHHSERKKARPKFYFFDCGVVRALHNRLVDPPTPNERGFLFETWFVGELRRMSDYGGKHFELSYYRERNAEIDIIVSDGSGPRLGVEIKSGTVDIGADTVDLCARRFPGLPLVVASLTDDRPRLTRGIEILPWPDALARCLAL